MEHMNWHEDGHQVNPMAQHSARMHSEARGYLFEFTLCRAEQHCSLYCSHIFECGHCYGCMERAFIFAFYLFCPNAARDNFYNKL